VLLHRSSPPEGVADAQREADAAQDDPDRDTDEDADGRGVESVVDEEADDHPTHDAADQESTEADEVAAAQAALGRVIGHPVWSVRAVGAWSSGRRPCTSAKGVSEKASAGDDPATLPQRFGRLRAA
jgi:hypothetical protein